MSHTNLKGRDLKTWENRLPEWLASIWDNQRRIGTRRGDVNQIQDIDLNYGKPTLYLWAAGASATLYEHSMAEMDGVHVATPTVMPWLRAHNFRPDVLVNVESNPDVARHVEENDAEQLWSAIEGAGALADKFDIVHWFGTFAPTGGLNNVDHEATSYVLSRMVPVSGWVPQLGCVTNSALMVLESLRHSGQADFERIVLIGADYCYWQDQSRLPLDGHTLYSVSNDPFRPYPKDALRYEGVLTDSRMLAYKADLLYLWAEFELPLYSLSHGILDEIPRTTFGGIRSGDWLRQPSREERIAAFESFRGKYARYDAK